MEIGTIIAALDQQIERLQQARTILLGEPPAKRRGRPKGSANESNVIERSAVKKRTMSTKGKARTADAQDGRQATQKKAST